jgi:NADH-quinone oxidoreductase subunit M
MEHILLYIVFLPVIAGILLLFFRNTFAKYLAFIVALAEVILTVLALLQYKTGEGFGYFINIPWLKNWGINLELGMDGISLLMILLTSLAIPLIMLAGWDKHYHNYGLMHGMTLVLQGALMGVFLSLNAFVYYLFWEMALIPAYLILLLWGGENRMRITLKFFIYTFAGSIFMLVGMMYLYKMTPGVHSFSHCAFTKLQLTTGNQVWPFIAFMIAFMIKTPIFPFHTWQPETYTQAPSAGTMLLGGLMSKMGLFSILRWIFPILPLAVKTFAPYIMWLAVGGLIYASVIALQQKNLKTMFAYSSMAHVGMIAAALFSLNSIAVQGALFQMFSHGITIIALFFVADIFKIRTDSQDITDFSGYKSQAPVFAAFYLVVLFASIGFPLTSGFVGEFLMITGLTGVQIWFGAAAGLSIILGAVYMLTSYRTTMLGELKIGAQGFADLNLREIIVFTALLAIIIVAGVFPSIMLRLSESSSIELLSIFK